MPQGRMRKDDRDGNAERRRQALLAFMSRHDLQAARWARNAQLPSANAIYNFLSGRSCSLSQPTLERLVSVVPGSSISHLIGERDIVANDAMCYVKIIGEIRANVWLETFVFPEQQQYMTAVPLVNGAPKNTFGLVVADLSADQICSIGTILVCVPIGEAGTLVAPGRHVIVVRHRDNKVEATVRQIVLDTHGGLWLVPRSTQPEFQQSLSLPWPYSGPFETGDGAAEISAVVIGRYTPE